MQKEAGPSQATPTEVSPEERAKRAELVATLAMQQRDAMAQQLHNLQIDLSIALARAAELEKKLAPQGE